jgi:hypothetical protein
VPLLFKHPIVILKFTNETELVLNDVKVEFLPIFFTVDDNLVAKLKPLESVVAILFPSSS